MLVKNVVFLHLVLLRFYMIGDLLVFVLSLGCGYSYFWVIGHDKVQPSLLF